MISSDVTLLMTRPNADAERFVADLPASLRARLNVLYAPLIRIDALKAQPDIRAYKGLILTSSNGLEVATQLSIRPSIPCFCVGTRTTQRAQFAGWDARCMGATANELVAALSAHRPAAPLLHLRGIHARGDVASRLTQLGLVCNDCPIYEQTLLSFHEDVGEQILQRPTVCPVFSPRTAERLSEHHIGSNNLYLAALSADVAAALRAIPAARLEIAVRPDAGAMAMLVETLVNEASRVEAGRGAQ